MIFDVYVWLDEKIKKRTINESEWHSLPHSILKVVQIFDNKKYEIFGYGAYILWKGKIIGLNQVGTDEPLENIFPVVPDYVKFGIAIPDKNWKDFQRYQV